MTDIYLNRVLVSLHGKCPMNCKHCYTYDLENDDADDSIIQIVEGISNSIFDVIYVSQKNENFYDEEKGFSLCEMLYNKYHKDILIITRCILSDEMIEQLSKLNRKMHSHGNQLYFAASICGEKSYSLTEDYSVCPTPKQRLSTLKRVHEHCIKTILLLRPVFPNSVIPVGEYISILKQAKNFIDAVISSGLILTDGILRKLGFEKDMFTYLESGDSTYLSDLRKDSVFYVDVEKELYLIQNECSSQGIAFFRHSLPALNYIALTN